ncbi:hypothetical protein SmJEL517_g00814 [Synchytrium microbalum]|uniref:Ribokinase n=1 Tax=Synchytrium microbalum TaxID=1806994 RepID=A0A507CCG6_9FUNG|nr:uncharacterized protein SmJEL517_g00814 [Synchytrium microbalum]TPX37191.1 hypothetical protein SmJEL517_g00814 [Synchytrium microbalum]
MPKILCYGSINIDDIFQVNDIVKPGETISSSNYIVLPGGKGANQSVALAKNARPQVSHAGKIGQDGRWVLDEMERDGVDTSLVYIDPVQHTGRAIIQVSESTKDNAIVLSAGANKAITLAEAERILKERYEKGSWLVLQNEISSLPEIITTAHSIGWNIAFNPAPCPKDLVSSGFPLNLCTLLTLNESEASSLSNQLLGSTYVDKKITVADAESISKRFFGSLGNLRVVVITLGLNGAVASFTLQPGEVKTVFQPALKVKSVDTTGAGDTFTGYFITELVKSYDGGVTEEVMQRALIYGVVAAAISTQSPGAMRSIPERDVVIEQIRDAGWTA